MKYLVSILTVIFFLTGCSDSYDSALEDKKGDVLTNSKEVIISAENTADNYDVNLSEETETQISDLKNKIAELEQQNNSTDNNSSLAVLDVIDDTVEAIAKVKEEINNSNNLSEQEKEQAIAEIDKIERTKFQEGLEAYTESIKTTEEPQTTNSNEEVDCEKFTNNTGALPPTFPPDECL